MTLSANDVVEHELALYLSQTNEEDSNDFLPKATPDYSKPGRAKNRKAGKDPRDRNKHDRWDDSQW